MKTVKIDFNDFTAMVKLMDDADKLTTLLVGKNMEGERTFTSIHPHRIEVTTLQKNGWVRKNVLYRHGGKDEFFEGKWIED